MRYFENEKRLNKKIKQHRKEKKNENNMIFDLE